MRTCRAGSLSKVARATLYAGAAALVIGGSLLAPRHQVLAQPSGIVVPASRTGHAIPVPPRQVVVNGRAPGKAVDHPLLTLDPVALQKGKKAANDRAAAALRNASPASSHPTRPYDVYNGNNFPGLATDGNSTPSDSTGAVGPGHYVEMVNTTIGVRPIPGPGSFTKLGLGPFAAINPTDCAFDPQISWDQVAGRWLYALDDQVSTNCGPVSSNNVAFGWSKTSDPSDLVNGWCKFVIGTGPYFFDYPKLGHDNTFMNIGANVFSPTFITSVIISINKPAHGSTACVAPSFTIFGSPGAHLKNADGTDAFTPVPAVTTDSYTAGYVVAAHYAGGGPQTKIMVWHVSSNAGTPVLTADGDMTVASYGVPPSIPQPVTGATSCSTTGNCLDSLDGRLTQAVARFDPSRGETIWTQHAVTDLAIGPRSVERWYQLAGTTLRQAGVVSDPALHIWNGAISPSAAGNEAVIFYNAGNGMAGGFASFRAQSRNSSTPAGTTTNETVLASSTVNDNDYSCGVNRNPVSAAPCRWGDYSAARPDPVDANVVWGTNMLTGTGGSLAASGWATQFAGYTPGCASTTISPKPTTAVIGTMVQFPVTSIGCLQPQYELWLQYPAGTGTWTIKRPFSANPITWDTAGYAAGAYNYVVWGNQTGDSTASWESFDSGSITLTKSPCTSATLTPGNSPVAAGTIVNFAATAAPCPIPYFQFWLQAPGGGWIVKQPFSALATWSWDTSLLVPGTYNVVVWANQRGDSTATFEAFAESSITVTGCGPVTLTPASGTMTAGPTVNLVATASVCANPRYQFWMLAPGSSAWVIVQKYGIPNSFSWNTAGKGPATYSFMAWAQDAKSGGASGNTAGRWDSYTLNTYKLTSTPCTTLSVTATPPSPQTVGTPVAITGFAGGGCANPLYQFWMLAPGSTTWKIVQPYSASATFNWPAAGQVKGTYHFSVWARDNSSSGTSGNSLGRWDISNNPSYQLN